MDTPPEDFDDGYSFIETFDSMSTTTGTSTTTASTVKLNKKNRYYKDSRRPQFHHHVCQIVLHFITLTAKTLSNFNLQD